MVDAILTYKSSATLWLKVFAGLVWDKCKAHAFLILLCLAFFTSAFIINISLERELGSSANSYLEFVFGFILPIAFVTSFILVFLYLLLIKRSKSPTKAISAFYRPLLTNPQRYANAIPVIGCLLLAFIAFADMKPLIPTFNPYSWDERFMRLDRLLHFGHDPWRLLDPFLGHPLVTQWINYIYNIWYIIMFSFWIGASWSTKTHKDHALNRSWERQFLLSFVLCWIIGGMMIATVYSSMGPAFYDLIDPINNPYSVQIAKLDNIHNTHTLWAVDTQALLRETFLNEIAGELSGISAMPSIHNATSTLFMLAAYRINKKFGHLMLVFMTCILFGSVHLAWHYAVDAYLGILIALILWKLTGILIQWQDNVLPPK